MEGNSGGPRLLTREGAAAYLSVSTHTIDRLIAIGELAIVRLPVTRHKNDVPVRGESRRVLIDRAELDAIVERNRTMVRSAALAAPTAMPVMPRRRAG